MDKLNETLSKYRTPDFLRTPLSNKIEKAELVTPTILKVSDQTDNKLKKVDNLHTENNNEGSSNTKYQMMTFSKENNSNIINYMDDIRVETPQFLKQPVNNQIINNCQDPFLINNKRTIIETPNFLKTDNHYELPRYTIQETQKSIALPLKRPYEMNNSNDFNIISSSRYSVPFSMECNNNNRISNYFDKLDYQNKQIIKTQSKEENKYDNNDNDNSSINEVQNDTNKQNKNSERKQNEKESNKKKHNRHRNYHHKDKIEHNVIDSSTYSDYTSYYSSPSYSYYYDDNLDYDDNNKKNKKITIKDSNNPIKSNNDINNFDRRISYTENPQRTTQLLEERSFNNKQNFNSLVSITNCESFDRSSYYINEADRIRQIIAGLREKYRSGEVAADTYVRLMDELKQLYFESLEQSINISFCNKSIINQENNNSLYKNNSITMGSTSPSRQNQKLHNETNFDNKYKNGESLKEIENLARNIHRHRHHSHRHRRH